MIIQPEFEVTLIYIYNEDFSLHFISEMRLEYIVAALVHNQCNTPMKSVHMGGPTVALQFDEREAWRDVNAV